MSAEHISAGLSSTEIAQKIVGAVDFAGRHFADYGDDVLQWLERANSRLDRVHGVSCVKYKPLLDCR